MKILLTGGAGFIGHHIIDYILKKTDWQIAILDRLDFSGNLNRLYELDNFEKNKKRTIFIWHDLKSEINEFIDKKIGAIDYVIHLAASTHVDRSIENPTLFAMDNVVGTTNLLNWIRKKRPQLKRFINFNTDEVFGPAPLGYKFSEDEPHKPSNPYSASKSGQGAMGYAFFITYGTPIITTYTMNNFGERQHPEKLIPKCISSIIKKEPMPIFSELTDGNVMKAVGSRFWLHCQNTASAMLYLLERGIVGESYNVIGFDERTNLEIAEKVADLIGKPLLPHFIDFHKARPGHDRRYALDGTKLKNLGWKPEISFDDSLKRTVEFTLNNPQWLT